MNLQPIIDACRQHAWILFAWLIVTAIVNTVFHFATPTDVDAWAERNPFVAKVAALFRRLGFEPVALLALIASFFSSNPPPPGPLGRLKDAARRDAMRPPTTLRAALLALSFTWCAIRRAAPRALAVVGVTLLVAACGLLSNPKLPLDGEKAQICVEDGAIRGHSIAVIAIDCGMDIVQVIADIFGSGNAEVQKSPARAEAERASRTLGDHACR